MPDITCPVCHSINASTRTFCWKCAADLHAPVADPAAPPPSPKVEVPLQPLLIGGGVALAAIALIAVLVVALTGSPAATIAPSLAPTAALPSSAAGSDGGGGASAVPTAVAASTAPITEPPPTAGPAATPKITPIPAPAILFFTGPQTVDCTDPGYSGFIRLQWEVTDADSTSLSIDGPGVFLTYPGVANSTEVPFSCGAGQHTYTLTTIGGNGPPASKTLTIKQAT